MLLTCKQPVVHCSLASGQADIALKAEGGLSGKVNLAHWTVEAPVP